LAQDWINANEGYLPASITGKYEGRDYEMALRTLFSREDGTPYIDFMIGQYRQLYDELETPKKAGN
jgi:hypothetical protein